jgi:hypothetical protein
VGCWLIPPGSVSISVGGWLLAEALESVRVFEMKFVSVRNSSRPAMVDDEDFDRINQRTWRLAKNSNKRKVAYAVSDRRIRGKVVKVLMHREVLCLSGDELVDHRNRDGLDNRKANLRIASASQNQGNRTKRHDNTSGYKGVTWDSERKKWRATIQERKLGRFDSPKEAARAYDEAALELWGDFALLNFPRV